MDERIRALEERLSRAERQVKTFRRLALGAAAGAAVLALVSPARTQGGAIKVTKISAPFQVVDGAGRLLLLVESGKPGPHLQLFDSSGRPAVELGTGDRGGGQLEVFDRTGKPVFTKPDRDPKSESPKK